MNHVPELVDFITFNDLNGIKIFFTHYRHSKLMELRDQIISKYPDRFSHAFSLPFCPEFIDKSVDKSVAIGKILRI